MRYEELPLMVCRDYDNQPWIGPFHVLKLVGAPDYSNLAFMPGSGLLAGRYFQAKPCAAPQRKTRLMTRDEVLAVAGSPEGLGWVVRFEDDLPQLMCAFRYGADMGKYLRSRPSPTGDYNWEPLEITL